MISSTDGWIHARMAVMRGVENGFAVVRSAFLGVEAVSDAQGRLLASASTVQPAWCVLSADVYRSGLVPRSIRGSEMSSPGSVWRCALGLAAMLFKKRP